MLKQIFLIEKFTNFQILTIPQSKTIHNFIIFPQPYLCEASYVLLEYAKTAMFMWMFIEGLYLHNMITVTVFQERQYYGIYYAMGWGLPIWLTSAWAVTNALYYNGQTG